MRLPIQVLVRLRLLWWRKGIKYQKNLFWRHANHFECMLIQLLKDWKKNNDGFTVLCLSSYFVADFVKLKLTFVYNQILYYYSRIFLILIPPSLSLSIYIYIYIYIYVCVCVCVCLEKLNTITFPDQNNPRIWFEIPSYKQMKAWE